MGTRPKTRKLDRRPERTLYSKFIHSWEWEQFAALVKDEEPLCQDCGERASEHVHHLHDPVRCPQFALSREHVRALCHTCHRKRHA